MTNAYQGLGARAPTPQREPIPGAGQVENNAGGYVWQIDDWKRLERFLILGSDGPTYYVQERALTLDNAAVLRRCLAADGPRLVRTIVEISDAGRAPRNTPAILALALACGEGDDATKAAAAEALPRICRTATHLFQFASLVEQFRGWGRRLRRSVGSWYTAKTPDALAYQLVKYRNREGWAHRDLLRLAHPKPLTPQMDNLLMWAVKGAGEEAVPLPAIVEGFVRLQAATTAKDAAALIRAYRLPRECVPTQFLSDAETWAALLDVDMPITALIRNLGKMTEVGLVKPMSDAAMKVGARLRDGDALRKGRVHPIQILSALTTYAKGHGVKGSLTWAPVSTVVDALNDAFYASFGYIEPTGKRTLIALDVSGSMDFPTSVTVSGLTARDVSAAMSMVVARTEPRHQFIAFSTGVAKVGISASVRLDDVVKGLRAIPFGGTDCSVPMLWAAQEGVEVDTFVIYTDSETHSGLMHPVQALRRYRDEAGIPARLAVCGVSSTGFSIADPNDGAMLDLVGFDTSAPAVLADFARASPDAPVVECA